MKGINTQSLERIAESWDGCMYDAVGESIDIGKCLRQQFAALSPPVADISGQEGEREKFEKACADNGFDYDRVDALSPLAWQAWQWRAALSQPPAVQVPEGYKLVQIEPAREVISAMATSSAKDDEGDFPPLMDLLDFSGENKLHTVLRAAYRAALDSSPSPAAKKEGGEE